MKTIRIHSEYITLGQLLKYADVLQSGGEIKIFLSENQVWVNQILENRRGRKLFPGDKIDINHKTLLVIATENDH
ncbi:MAG TPA: S4 domain-containing protein YaaA [Candidatus Izemoplasmatales bacterium]|nr:S4 domain-containing protein YaaA [Bacillota bacterium]HRY77250.1 S4 domain-containing protein YaaA [Candidatus Izemoplasmatales bacterium]